MNSQKIQENKKYNHSEKNNEREIEPNASDDLKDFLLDLYNSLLNIYGPQGWWPLLEFKENKINPTNRGILTGGYHPGDFSYPKTENQILEIMIGAILTQNTNWANVEKALIKLEEKNLINVNGLLKVPIEELADLIRSSGYYNQKAVKLKNLAEFLKDNKISELKKKGPMELHEILISVKGIGPETADSMILYGLKKPIFVIDAYTRRLLYRMNRLQNIKEKYENIQKLFHDNLPVDVQLYNEYHALIVQHCATICKKKPLCNECKLKEMCPKRMEPATKKKTKSKRED